jgi:hypothetical protein
VVWTEGKGFEAAFLWRTANPKSRDIARLGGISQNKPANRHQASSNPVHWIFHSDNQLW